MKTPMKQSTNKPASYEWVAPFGVRYPLIVRSGMVPLRPLAQALGVSFQSLVSAAARLPVKSDISWVLLVAGPGDERPQITLAVPAEWLPFLLVAATPRKVTDRFHALRGQMQALSVLHPPQSAPAAHQAVARAAVLAYELKVTRQALDEMRRSSAAANGQRFIERRWGTGNRLTEETMLQIAELARKGTPLKTIAFHAGKDISTISLFLAGKYNSAAARDFYQKHGVPEKSTSGDGTPGQQNPP